MITIEELNKTQLDEVVKNFEEYLADLKMHDVDQPYWSNVDTWIDEYNMDHDIFDREDKIIGEGEKTSIVETAKIGVPFQKKVVSSAVSFLFGEPVKLILNNEGDQYLDSFGALKDIWKSAKLDYHNRKLARKLFVETRAAELFYVRKNGDEKKVKVMTLCKSNGDSIYPHWDELGDMDAFIREYQWNDEENKERQKVEIYTAEQNYICIKRDDWSVTRYPNILGKIPVIFYEQENNEWEDVQSMIDRIEMMVSKNADTNDYFGSPAIVAKGKLKNAPEKGEVGKFFEIQGESDEGRISYGTIEYLTWDRTPESMKMEFDILKDLIYSMTSTPDLSFNNVKGTGNLSGIALKFMFLDSMMKSRNKEEVFGECLERRINLLKDMIVKVMDVGLKNAVDLDIEIEFQDGLPENMQEVIQMLTEATGGDAVMSQESAVRRNPLVDNPDGEIEQLKQQAQQKSAIPESYV